MLLKPHDAKNGYVYYHMKKLYAPNYVLTDFSKSSLTENNCNQNKL